MSEEKNVSPFEKAMKDFVKENKRSIIKKSLIVVGATAGVVLAVFLLKKDRVMTEEYFEAIDDKPDAIGDRFSIIRDLLPGAAFEEDNEGQILIYTGEYSNLLNESTE